MVNIQGKTNILVPKKTRLVIDEIGTILHYQIEPVVKNNFRRNYPNYRRFSDQGYKIETDLFQLQIQTNTGEIGEVIINIIIV